MADHYYPGHAQLVDPSCPKCAIDGPTEEEIEIASLQDRLKSADRARLLWADMALTLACEVDDLRGALQRQVPR